MQNRAKNRGGRGRMKGFRLNIILHEKTTGNAMFSAQMFFPRVLLGSMAGLYFVYL
jgi:hypothetical protein